MIIFIGTSPSGNLPFGEAVSIVPVSCNGFPTCEVLKEAAVSPSIFL